MNTEHDVTKFIIALAELFPGTISDTKARMYKKLLSADLVSVDLLNLTEKIANQFKYFPSVREIKDLLGTRQKSHRELAAEFVDTMISLFLADKNVYESAGPANYNFWKETIGLTKHDFQNIEPHFHRGAWIDRVVQAYENYERRQLQVADNIARLTGDT